jgi:hypothetical protein
MHDTASMLADFREAVGDMSVPVTVTHRGGARSVIADCAVSDIAGSNRMVDDEGIMESADVSVSYAVADARKPVEPGDKAAIGAKLYRVLRVTYDRAGVSAVAECQEVQ